jgi:hypothetical protein
MSGRAVGFVRNDAGATCPNTLHCVTLKDRRDVAAISAVRETPFFQFSSEIERHPLVAAC